MREARRKEEKEGGRKEKREREGGMEREKSRKAGKKESRIIFISRVKQKGIFSFMNRF